MAVSISISITQNNQVISANLSNVTVKVNATWTGGSFNRNNPAGWLKIDGKQYNFNSSFNANQTTSGSQTLFTKSVSVSHNADGTKTLACSASFTSGVSSGTVTASASKTLTAIAQESTLSVANGTLGTEQTLTITRKTSTTKHRLKYICSGASGYILGSGSGFSTTLSTKWTPPKSLAQYNTWGTSVTVQFELYTYTSGGEPISTNYYSKSYAIPTDIKPSCSISVSDATAYFGKFGKYVQGKSRLKIDVTGSGIWYSSITNYKTTVDGKLTYTSASFTTNTISSNKSITIASTVTDSRGRTGSSSKSVDVYPYSPPKITALNTFRCNADGTANSSGEYLAVVFSSQITALDNKNTVSYKLQYKKATDEAYTTKTLSEFAGMYSVSNGRCIIPAEKNSSYNFTLVVNDYFGSVTKTITGASIKKWFSILKSTFGFAIGKVAELPNVFDIALQTRFSGGILHPVLEPNTDLNDVLTPNTYVGANLSTHKYLNCPLTSGTFSLEVIGEGEAGQRKQKLTSCSKYDSKTWERTYYTSSWGEWFLISGAGTWKSITLKSNFVNYSADRAPRYKTNGNIVFIEGAVKPTETITSNEQTVAFATDLPAEIRPTKTMNFVCQGSGINRWLLTVGTNGELFVSRYGAEKFSDIPTTAWLIFNVTYMV